jgi:hypothetical protein
VAKPLGEHTHLGGFVSKEVSMDWFFYILEFLGQFDGAWELGLAGFIVVVSIGALLIGSLAAIASWLYTVAR